MNNNAEPQGPATRLNALELLLHQTARGTTAKQAAQALLHQHDTAAAARDALVMEKRRLEGVARALGVSRKTAAELAKAYFSSVPAAKP